MWARLGLTVLIFLEGAAVLAASGLPGSNRPISVSLSGSTWAVEVRAAGFSLTADQSAPGGKRRIMAADDTRDLAISVQLEQVDHQPTLDECRQYQRDRIKSLSAKFDLRNIKYWDDGKMAFAEDFVPQFEGKPVKQESLFACFSRENVFVDIHISKSLYEPKDEELLTAVMGTVYVADKKAEGATGSGPSSMDLFVEGSALYNKGQFSKSIRPYQQALNLEKSDRRLERDFWRVLVDNLGIANGITGDLKKAKETFDYGVSEDKSYPLFYYNLACTYAGMNDLEKTKSNLKTAFDYKENLIRGESMPDPRTDDSFQEFMKDKDFRRFVDSLMNPSK
jgi:tetratricopeptide (TPR) repeat protein